MNPVPITFVFLTAVIVLMGMSAPKAISGLLSNLAPPGTTPGYGQLQSSSIAMWLDDTRTHRHHRLRRRIARSPGRGMTAFLATLNQTFALNIVGTHHEAPSPKDTASSPASTFTQITPSIEAVTPRTLVGRLTSSFQGITGTFFGSTGIATHRAAGFLT